MMAPAVPAGPIPELPLLFVLSQISLTLGGRPLLSDVSFTVNDGECFGLVGPNGCGKSTLLRIAAGIDPPDSGTVTMRSGASVGYLAQDGVDGRRGTLRETFPALFSDDLQALAEKLALASDPAEVDRLSEQYGSALAAIGESLVQSPNKQRGDWLALRDVDPGEPIDHISGGERTRLAILNLAATNPDVLLLDEPTNHLDVEGIGWLERFIIGFQGAVIVVSHDRTMLNACATSIVELEPRDGSATVFAGNYETFAAERARRDAAQRDAFQRQEAEERRRKRVISAIESRARSIENETIDFHYRKRAKKVARRSTTLKARLERDAASADHIDRPAKPISGPSGRFAAPKRGPTRALSMDGVTLGFPGRDLLRDVHLDIERGERVCLTGPNGTGKTTLIRAILGEHVPSAGTVAVSRSAAVGHIGQEGPTREPIGPAGDNAIDIVRRWSAMSTPEATNFLHWFFFTGDQLRTPAGELSLGERQRLALARFFVQPTDLLLLDEPTNHLDIPATEAFEESLAGFEGAALIVTHDRHFLDQYADRVLAIENGRLVLV